MNLVDKKERLEKDLNTLKEKLTEHKTAIEETSNAINQYLGAIAIVNQLIKEQEETVTQPVSTELAEDLDNQNTDSK